MRIALRRETTCSEALHTRDTTLPCVCLTRVTGGDPAASTRTGREDGPAAH